MGAPTPLRGARSRWSLDYVKNLAIFELIDLCKVTFAAARRRPRPVITLVVMPAVIGYTARIYRVFVENVLVEKEACCYYDLGFRIIGVQPLRAGQVLDPPVQETAAGGRARKAEEP